MLRRTAAGQASVARTALRQRADHLLAFICARAAIADDECDTTATKANRHFKDGGGGCGAAGWGTCGEHSDIRIFRLEGWNVDMLVSREHAQRQQSDSGQAEG